MLAVPVLTALLYGSFIVLKIVITLSINLMLALLHTAALEMSAVEAFSAAQHRNRPEFLIIDLLLVIAMMILAGWAGHLYHHKIKNGMIAIVYLFVALLLCKMFVHF